MGDTYKERLKKAAKISALVGLYAEEYLCKEPQRTTKLTSINLKRKRVQLEGVKKMSVSGSERIADRIADAISRIADSFETQAQVIARTSIREVVADLLKIEAVSSDIDWFGRCCSVLLSQSAREMFVALKPREEKLLAWLKFEAYKAR